MISLQECVLGMAIDADAANALECTVGLLQTKTFAPASDLASAGLRPPIHLCYSTLPSYLYSLFLDLPLCASPACSASSLLPCAPPSPWPPGRCPPPPQRDSSQTIQRCPSGSLILFQTLPPHSSVFNFETDFSPGWLRTGFSAVERAEQENGRRGHPFHFYP